MNLLKNISFGKRNKILLWGGLIVLALIYQLTFKKTISLFSECSALEKKAEMASGALQKISLLQKEAARLDLLSGSVQNRDSNIQQRMLGIVTAYCQSNNILLKEFPGTQTFRENNYLIEMNRFTIEGNFKGLLGLVYCLEQKHRIGKVSSIDFNTRKDPRTKKAGLIATVYLQNIKRT